jgi:hypothetical protein
MAIQLQLEGNLKAKDADCRDLKTEECDFLNSKGFQTLQLEMRQKRLAHIESLVCK